MTDDPQSVLHDLAKRLLAQTRDGRVTWDISDPRGAFVHTRSAGTVIIESRDRDGSFPYRLTILDPDGTAVEQLNTSPPRASFVTEWDDTLSDLYEAARRQAFKVDEVLHNFLDDLG